VLVCDFCKRETATAVQGKAGGIVCKPCILALKKIHTNYPNQKSFQGAAK
jgi:hypothetical protein